MINKHKTYLEETLKRLIKYFSGDKKWFYGTILFLLAYLAFIQPHFLFSGDVWAEAFPQYVNDALNSSWTNIFSSGWAGYLAIVPAFMSKLYIHLGLPLGYIDIYFRIITIVFAIVCISFISHPINRHLIKNDKIRVALAFIMLLSIRHISALAFINIWYLGFIVIILVCLSKSKMNLLTEISFTLFAILIALSKSSSLLLPFLIYYAIRTKRYISSSLIAVAVILQTYLTVFAKNGYGNGHISTNLLAIIRDVILGISVFVFKVLHIIPINVAVIILISIILIIICVFLVIKNGLWKISVILSGLFISVYLYVFAPDSSFNNLLIHYTQLYQDTFKVQRGILIIFFIILLIGIFLSNLVQIYEKNGRKSKLILIIIAVILTILINPFSKIDTTSLDYQSDISTYRSFLNNKQSVCMPVPPQTWFFQYKGGCYAKETLPILKLNSFTQFIGSKGLNIAIDTTPKDELKTMVIILKGNPPITNNKIILTDKDSGRTFFANITQNNELYHSINFNLIDLGTRNNQYNFKLRILRYPEQYSVSIVDKKPFIYAYFMGYPNIQ